MNDNSEQILEEKKNEITVVEESNRNMKTPKDIYNELNKYVIGQDEAKKILSVAAFNHCNRIIYNQYINSRHDLEEPLELQKSNVLLMGTTGSGKTLLVRSLAKILDVPLYIGDATKITSAGYVGGNIEDFIQGLLQSAGWDEEKAENGILYIDEGDKLAKCATASGKDIGGEGVQQALLAMMEGMVVDCSNSYIRRKVDTTNILFIIGGAFSGIDKIISNRIGMQNKSMGFGSELHSKDDKYTESELILKAVPRDLVNFGMIPELIGRLPVKAKLSTLDEDMLVKILTEPKDAVIKQYKMLFDMNGCDLEFEEDALKLIAKIAIDQNTGARGLRTIIEEVMLPIMFDLPLDDEEFVVTKKMVEDVLEKI